MEFVRTLGVELNEEEENAIETVLAMFDDMWGQSGNYEMEELWENYGSEEEGWICIENTLRNLLKGSK